MPDDPLELLQEFERSAPDHDYLKAPVQWALAQLKDAEQRAEAAEDAERAEYNWRREAEAQRDRLRAALRRIKEFVDVKRLPGEYGPATKEDLARWLVWCGLEALAAPAQPPSTPEETPGV